LYNKYEKPDEWRLSKVKRSARSVSSYVTLAMSDSLTSPSESNVRVIHVPSLHVVCVLLLHVVSHIWLCFVSHNLAGPPMMVMIVITPISAWRAVWRPQLDLHPTLHLHISVHLRCHVLWLQAGSRIVGTTTTALRIDR
jgi:hypothetical protein